MDNGQEMQAEAVERFFPGAEWTAVQGKGGMNNTTRFIRLSGGGEYVLRIYETHRDLDKVLFEHEVLRALESKQLLSFRTPVPACAATGETVVRIGANGKLAAIFSFTEGQTPDFCDAGRIEAYGAAVGELQQALAVLRLESEPVYRPYYELEHTHPGCPLREAVQFCEEPPIPFDGLAYLLQPLAHALRSFGKERPAIEALPHQIIHGDLNASNMLVKADGSTVAAILDFEFATWDVRAMEPAVCLWDFIPNSMEGQTEKQSEHQLEVDEIEVQAEDQAVWERMGAFLRGYSSKVRLKQAELEAIPLLMELRSLDVFLHFLGRCRDGVDEPSVLEGFIRDTSARIRWMTAHRASMAHRCREYQSLSPSSHFLE